MQNLIIGLGGAGNNIVSYLQEKKVDNLFSYLFKLIKILTEIRLLRISLYTSGY